MSFLLFFLLLVSSGTYCQEAVREVAEPEWNPTLTVEENVAIRATPFQTNSEFPFLDELAKTKSVLILGESGHIDHTTSEAIIHMIQYLKKKGFNTLAKESIPFLTSYLFSNLRYTKITKEKGKWFYIFDGFYYIRDQKIYIKK